MNIGSKISLALLLSLSILACDRDEVSFDKIILISPEDSSTVRTTDMKFIWYGPNDVEFKLYLEKDSIRTLLATTNKKEYPIPYLIYNQSYSWQVETIGSLGNTLQSSRSNFLYKAGSITDKYPGFVVPQRFGFVGDSIKFIPIQYPDELFEPSIYTMSWDFDLDSLYELENSTYGEAFFIYNSPGFHSARVHLKDASGIILQYTFYITITKRPDNPIGTILDQRDGQLYRTVQIGHQTWMAHNLNYAFLSNDSINQIMTSFSVVGGQGFYGMHYAGMAAQNACPEGWHLPSDEEWMELERFIGMSEDELYLSGGGRGAGLDDKIKASFDWSEPVANSNSTGFGALPAGYWFSERSYNWGFSRYYTAFWSWNEADNIQSFGRSLYHDRDEIRRYMPLSTSFSARCLRDN